MAKLKNKLKKEASEASNIGGYFGGYTPVNKEDKPKKTLKKEIASSKNVEFHKDGMSGMMPVSRKNTTKGRKSEGKTKRYNFGEGKLIERLTGSGEVGKILNKLANDPKEREKEKELAQSYGDIERVPRELSKHRKLRGKSDAPITIDTDAEKPESGSEVLAKKLIARSKAQAAARARAEGFATSDDSKKKSEEIPDSSGVTPQELDGEEDADTPPNWDYDKLIAIFKESMVGINVDDMGEIIDSKYAFLVDKSMFTPFFMKLAYTQPQYVASKKESESDGLAVKVFAFDNERFMEFFSTVLFPTLEQEGKAYTFERIRSPEDLTRNLTYYDDNYVLYYEVFIGDSFFKNESNSLKIFNFAKEKGIINNKAIFGLWKKAYEKSSGKFINVGNRKMVGKGLDFDSSISEMTRSLLEGYKLKGLMEEIYTNVCKVVGEAYNEEEQGYKIALDKKLNASAPVRKRSRREVEMDKEILKGLSGEEAGAPADVHRDADFYDPIDKKAIKSDDSDEPGFGPSLWDDEERI